MTGATRCGCCGTGTGGHALDALTFLGWSLAELDARDELPLLCPACSWQRREAADIVTAALEGAHRHDADASRTRARQAWFWA
jgi:hypothetical protein